MPWKRKWQPTPVSLHGKSHGQRSLVSCSPWGRKESGTTNRLTLTYLTLRNYRASLVAQLVKNRLQCRRPWYDSWVRKIHWRRDRLPTLVFLGFPGGSVGKEAACNVGDLGSIPELGRSPGGENGNLCQYSCLENPHGQRSLRGYSPWGRKESDMTERLGTQQRTCEASRATVKGLRSERKKQCRILDLPKCMLSRSI